MTILKHNCIAFYIPFLDLGEFCYTASGLNHIAEAECRDNLFRCKAPYVIAQNNRECRIGEVKTTDIVKN
jgi:hypothetical protein